MNNFIRFRGFVLLFLINLAYKVLETYSIYIMKYI